MQSRPSIKGPLRGDADQLIDAAHVARGFIPAGLRSSPKSQTPGRAWLIELSWDRFVAQRGGATFPLSPLATNSVPDSIALN
jgi:hypothetical protein